MRRVITRAKAVKYVIYGILALIVLCIFPFRVFDEDIQTFGKEHPAGSVAVGGENVALQQFTAEYDHISSIGVYIKSDYGRFPITLRVFKEENAQLLREVTVYTDDLQAVDSRTYTPERSEGYADIYINLDTEVGKGYFYTIESPETEVEVLYEMTGNSGAVNNGYMQYRSETKDAYNLMTRYTYKQPLRKGRSLIYIAILVAVAVILGAITGYLGKRSQWFKELCSISSVIKWVCNPLIIIGGMVCLIAVGPMHMFSIYIADLVVMSLGVIFLVLFLLYEINIGIDDRESDPAGYIRTNWQNLCQSVCIALALWACVNYVNGLYEVFHDIAWRKMAFFLGLSVIVTFSFAEVVNWYNLAALIAGIITARVYYVRNLPDMVDEYHTEAMLWTCRLMPVILIMIAYVVRSVVTLFIRPKENGSRQGILKIVSWPYAIFSMILAAGLIIRRHLDYWPILLAVIAGVYAFRFLFWSKRAAFINNILNGILLHFAGCVVFCLLHRPYEAYIYVRYPLVFHTVTITGEYLAFVMAAAAVKLFSKYHRTRQWKKCIGEAFIMGCVTSYMMFAMSRTAMIGVAAMGLVMWIAYSFRSDKITRMRSLAVMAALFVTSALICIPIAFTAQKAIPALVGEPRLMEIETYPQTLLISTDYESEDYITFSRLAKAFGHKMLGINEDMIKLDIYTINGKIEGLYLKPSDIAGQKTGASIDDKREYTDPGIMLSIEDTAYMPTHTGDFVPPHEYSLDGEPPEQWWDEDYWAYYPETGEWEFLIWKVEEDLNRDISNGRIDIYRSYWEQLTWEGHEEMGAVLDDGSIAMHAHNIYLQIAFDHGIIIGIMFIIWCAFTCIQALEVFRRFKDQDPAAGTVLAVSITYAVCGLTEWISHPVNPAGMIMFIIAVPMALYRYEYDINETVEF